MSRICIVLLSALWAFAAPLVTAQERSNEALFAEFDPAYLTREDTRFLQAALAFEGHYKGLLDGDWGRLSQEAFARYAAARFGSAPESWHMAMLAFSFFDQVERSGWEMHYNKGLDMSFLLPARSVSSDPTTKQFVNFRHTRSSLGYSIGVQSQREAQATHDYTKRQHASSVKPYSVRRRNIAISSARLRDGGYLYTRSDFRGGFWSTIIISVSHARDKPMLDAVASSIAKGRAAPLRLSEGGLLERVIFAALDVANKEKQPNVVSAPPPKEAPKGGSAGTGFYVSLTGHVLTNDHVVDGCTRYSIDGQPAKLVARSPEFDLALLQNSSSHAKAVAVFSAAPPKLNSDVTVVGYPYAGELSGLNVTRGAVSSLKGLSGDVKRLQITAPVQSGNSGGPLVGPDGEVIGVVVSKLDVFSVAEETGDMPQNVNFAVRGEIAKLFLSQNGVQPLLSLDDVPMSPTDIAERVSEFTTFIACE